VRVRFDVPRDLICLANVLSEGFAPVLHDTHASADQQDRKDFGTGEK
jgi:hypothetical protein